MMINQKIIIFVVLLIGSFGVVGGESYQSPEEEFEDKAIAVPYIKSHGETLSKCTLYLMSVGKVMTDLKINTIFDYSIGDIQKLMNESVLLEFELQKLENFKYRARDIGSHAPYYYEQIIDMLNNEQYVSYVGNEINMCRNAAITLKKITGIEPKLDE